jgi:uncharacterized protein YbbC (DUF1343 family)
MNQQKNICKNHTEVKLYKRYFYQQLFFLAHFVLLVSFNELFADGTITPSVKKIKLGVDVLIENGFDIIENKKILLLTNTTGRTSSGQLTVEEIQRSKKCEIIGLLTPEHGFFTTVPAGQSVNDDIIFGLKTYSLYGNSRKPDSKLLKSCDAVVVDIQDIGIRSYTYISTIFKTMQSCAENGIPVIILDRPNPLGGEIIDGNIVETGKDSFVGIAPISYIHGCTIGELAEMFNNERWLNPKNPDKSKCSLTVIKMVNWKRSMTYEETGLQWWPTSPHIPTVNAVRGAACLGIFGELGIINIGIGTTLPFQYVGAPDFKTEIINDDIKMLKLQGIHFNPTKFQPFYGMYNGKLCDGFFLTFTNDKNFAPYTSGILFFSSLIKYYPNMFDRGKLKQNSIDMFNKVTGSDAVLDALINKKSINDLRKICNKGLDNYRKLRQKYLLYD